MPMSDVATAQLALATFLIVAVCGFAFIFLVATLFGALDVRPGRKVLAPHRQVTPARRPARR